MNLKKYGLNISTAIIGLMLSNSVLATHSDLQSAIELREAIELKPSEQKFINASTTTSKTLPISRGFHQQETCLCWSYAFFNALETISLIDDPNSKLELSRGAMQYINIKDRIIEKIQGIDDHVNPTKYKGCWAEGGTAPDAAKLIRKYGVYQYNDYHDIISPTAYSNTINQIFSYTDENMQYKLTDSLLLNYFQYDLPKYTVYKDNTITAIDLGNQLAGPGKWVPYSISKNGTDYQAKSLDPDARVGGLVNFTSRDNVLKIIVETLENNSPVLYGNDHHLTMIYGVEYDQSKNPLSLFVKDSYNFHDGSYTYKADVQRLLNELGEITVYEP